MAAWIPISMRHSGVPGGIDVGLAGIEGEIQTHGIMWYVSASDVLCVVNHGECFLPDHTWKH